MPVVKYDQVEMNAVDMDGASGVSKAVTIGPREGWDDYVMRVFRLEPGGYTPKHAHDWEHVNYITIGSGKLTIGEETHDVEQGDFVFVPPNKDHQFRNPGDGEFEFICVVPERGEY